MYSSLQHVWIKWIGTVKMFNCYLQFKMYSASVKQSFRILYWFIRILLLGSYNLYWYPKDFLVLKEKSTWQC